MDFGAANHKRDRRLRRRLLSVLDAARSQPAGGWVSGRFVVDVLEGAAPERIEDDTHAAAMLRDLVAGGYAEHRDDRRYQWQRESLDLASWRVTAKGTALLSEGVDPDPLIEDQRLRKPQGGQG